MKFRPKLFFLLFGLIAAVAVLAAACGGDGDDEEEPAAADGSPAATATAAAPDETEEPSDNGDGDGEAPDIPSLPGATETFSGTYAGSDLPFGGFAGTSDLDPGEFSEVRYTVLETDDSVDSVVDFYKDQFKDWKEEFTFGGDTEGEAFQMIIWSRAGGEVGAWMMATESEGATEVIIVTGAQ